MVNISNPHNFMLANSFNVIGSQSTCPLPSPPRFGNYGLWMFLAEAFQQVI